jgi:hypothetical protein
MNEEDRWIILFRSIHHVIAAEGVFQERGVWCDMAPVPRSLSSDCGMAIEFRTSDLERVRDIFLDPRVQPHSVQQPCSDGYRNVTDRLT